MKDLLYLDYSDCAEKSRRLQFKLRTNKIDFDFVGEFIRSQGDVSSHNSANEEFQREYYSKLNYYSVLMAHGGVVFNNQISSIQNMFPELSVILISDFKNSMPYKEGKSLICPYASEDLIPFIREQLEKIDNPIKK